MSLNKPIVQEVKQITRLRIIKNLTVICLTFTLLFTAYDGLSMLQSTMNGKQGMGSYSQALIYIVFAVSSLLFPDYSIKKLGCKTNLLVGTLMYLPYIVSNAYPTWYNMMPSAVLVGFGGSILWVSQCTYFNEAAGLYYNMLNDDCVKTPPIDCKLGIKNSELLVIQDGISEKLISEMMSKDRFTQLDDVKETTTDSKLDSLKIIAKDSPQVKTFVINTNKGCDIDEADGKTEINYCENDNVFKVFNAIEQENFKSVTDSVAKFEKLNSQSEQCISKVYKYKHVTNIKTSNQNTIVCTSDADVHMRPSIVKIIGSNNNNTPRSSSIESVTARFFGCFGLVYWTAQVWSNLLSYYILNFSSESNKTITTNHSCGAEFCNNEYEPFIGEVDEVPLETRYLLIGITSTLSVTASLLLLIFLDPLNTDKEAVTFSLSHVMTTFNHLKKKEQIFMVPLSVFMGLSQGFFSADFTKSYIQCAWSISHVGLVAVFYGITSGISSSISGWMVKYLGRIPLVLLGLVLHLGNSVFLLLWNPDSEYPVMFYVGGGLLGTVVGLFYSQIQALYGLLFKNDEESAFSTYCFCTATGWMLSFIYSDFLCTSINIYILMIVSCVGVIGYLAADRSFHSRTIQ